MHSSRFQFGWLCALPLLAIALAGARPLHAVPGHAWIGAAVALGGVAAVWRFGAAVYRHGAESSRLLALAGGLLLAPWLLIAALWTGLGAPFQASAVENQQRYVLLVVDALLVGAGFVVLRDALLERGERLVGSAMFAAAVPASALYVSGVALTLAQATMAVQGDRTPLPPVLDHLYDVLEFFAGAASYVATALAAVAMRRTGLLGRTATRVVVGFCLVALALLLLRGIEYPEISGHTAPWYSQPGVVVRIPAMSWLLPGLLAAVLLRRAHAEASPDPRSTHPRAVPEPASLR